MKKCLEIGFAFLTGFITDAFSEKSISKYKISSSFKNHESIKRLSVTQRVTFND